MLFADSYWCCFSLVLMYVLCLYKTCVYHFYVLTAVCQFFNKRILLLLLLMLFGLQPPSNFFVVPVKPCVLTDSAQPSLFLNSLIWYVFYSSFTVTCHFRFPFLLYTSADRPRLLLHFLVDLLTFHQLTKCFPDLTYSTLTK